MRLYLALEYADSGNLREWLDARGGRLQEPLARWFLQQLVYGLDYCHAHGVYNRYVRRANARVSTQAIPRLRTESTGGRRLHHVACGVGQHTGIRSPPCAGPSVASLDRSP